ncbi:Arm DNA-binding domain-containing protein [Leptolyngbya ohadii]|uniref:Arm DNA-binding domain-containing protein n=1 Tax=Leptolyngbya ohadii TaxID=1962290 RepID=UPI0019D42FD5|nr:DUF3596 domain-containing protein [Leptolyngbya ohadii]
MITDVSRLPSLSLADKEYLPTISGVYFLLNKYGEVLYIGQSTNICDRWKSHGWSEDIREGLRIAWLAIPAKDLLLVIETALIAAFRPPYNKDFRGLKDDNGNELTPVIPYGEAVYRGLLKHRGKSPKGSVVVETDKGWLRLRWNHKGKRYSLALGLPDEETNREIAARKARIIQEDIKLSVFDKTLAKYRSGECS